MTNLRDIRRAFYAQNDVVCWRDRLHSPREQLRRWWWSIRAERNERGERKAIIRHVGAWQDGDPPTMSGWSFLYGDVGMNVDLDGNVTHVSGYRPDELREIARRNGSLS